MWGKLWTHHLPTSPCILFLEFVVAATSAFSFITLVFLVPLVGFVGVSSIPNTQRFTVFVEVTAAEHTIGDSFEESVLMIHVTCNSSRSHLSPIMQAAVARTHSVRAEPLNNTSCQRVIELKAENRGSDGW